MLKVAVIGVGYLGWHHARIYAGLPETKLVAVVDTDMTKAQETASKLNCKCFSHYLDVLAVVDAVSIVTPTTLHYEIAKTCLQANKHIFIEKPVTKSLSEADELLRLQNSYPSLCIQVGHIERFNPIIRLMSERMSEPDMFVSERLSPFTGRSADVDITLDLMIHDIDMLLSVHRCSDLDVQIVSAVGSNLLTGNIDMAEAVLRVKNQHYARLIASRLYPKKQRTLSLYKASEAYYIDYQGLTAKRAYPKGSQMKVKTFRAVPQEPLQVELMSFVSSVLSGKPPVVSLKDGRDALKVALDISDAIRQKKQLEV